MSKDAPLLPGDVIYIPPVGAQVAIAGDVHIPAIYELKGDTTVEQALRFAGGLSSTASLSRASLERVDAEKKRTVVDISLQAPSGLATPLQQGDLLRVLPISPQFQNTVTLRGNVAETGRFSWHPGMKLSDIIPDSQALITRDYWERRNQLGIPGPEFKPEYTNNPDYYPRDINGYQTGSAQYDINGVPIFNGQPQQSNTTQGQSANGHLPGQWPNPAAEQQPDHKSAFAADRRSELHSQQVLRSKIHMARTLDRIPRGSTRRTGNPAPPRAADHWPTRRRRRLEIFPGRP